MDHLADVMYEKFDVGQSYRPWMGAIFYSDAIIVFLSFEIYLNSHWNRTISLWKKSHILDI